MNQQVGFPPKDPKRMLQANFPTVIFSITSFSTGAMEVLLLSGPSPSTFRSDVPDRKILQQSSLGTEVVFQHPHL